MTVSTAYAPLIYNGNGVTSAFAVTWPFFTDTLVVTAISSTGVETVKTLTTHYTVTGGTTVRGLPSTGTVTMKAASIPAAGTTLRITRVTPRTQTTTWSENDNFPQAAIEAALDKATLITQELMASAVAGITGDFMQLDSSGATDYWDAEGQVIRNVADAVNATDAVNYSQIQDILVTAGAGDVVGPPSATSGNLASFDGVTGKIIADSGISFIDEDSFASNSATKVPSQQSVKAYVDQRSAAASRTIVKALDTSGNTAVYLSELGREGTFIWRTGDYSTQVAADTLEGIYIKADAVAATSGAWVRAFDGDVQVEWFGALGDGDGAGGGTNDAAAIQAAIDMADGTAVSLDGSKIYLVEAAIQMPSNTTINFNGATLDFTNLTATNNDFSANVKLCLYAKGAGRGASSALTSNAAVGDYTIAVNSGATFAAGDWVQITAENAYTYDGSTSVKKGEIVQVQSVSGNNVTLRTCLLDAYTTANTATLHKLSFVENINLNRPSIIGTNVENDRCEGIRLLWVKNFTIRDLHVRNVDMRAVHIANSIIGDIDGGHIDGVRYTGTGTLFYAVTLNNCVQWMTTRAIKAQEVRHLWVCSSSTADYGQPYFCTVESCHLWNAMAGGIYASYAYEHHGFGRFITIANNTANGCHSGLRIEGSDLLAVGNTFRNCRLYGISFSDGRAISNVVIADTRISFLTSELTSTRVGLIITPDLSCNYSNIVVDGLHIDGWFGPSSGSAMGCRIHPVGSLKGVVLNNINVYASAAANDLDYGFYIETGPVVINTPTVHNYRRAFRIIDTASGVTINNPTVSNDAVVGTAPAFQIGGDDVEINNPVIKTAYRAFTSDSTAADLKITGKIARSIIVADSVGGTRPAIVGGLLVGTATYDPASLADGAGVTTTVTVTGAALGDLVSVSFSRALTGIILTGWVSGSNTVSVRFQNESGSTVDLLSGTIKALVQTVN